MLLLMLLGFTCEPDTRFIALHVSEITYQYSAKCVLDFEILNLRYH